jgi:hypothetical protein
VNKANEPTHVQLSSNDSERCENRIKGGGGSKAAGGFAPGGGGTLVPSEQT